MLVFMFALNCPANEEENIKKHEHEIKLDIFFAVHNMLKLGYEYSLSNRTALSLTAGRDFTEMPEVKTYVFASCKYYLFKFNVFPWVFVENDLGYAKGRNFDMNGEYERKSYHAFLAGFAGGLKKFYPEIDTGLEIILGSSYLLGKGSNSCPDCNYDWVPQVSVNFVRRL
jgi:hypothetical protein